MLLCFLAGRSDLSVATHEAGQDFGLTYASRLIVNGRAFRSPLLGSLTIKAVSFCRGGRARTPTVVRALLVLVSCLLPRLTYRNGITMPDQDSTAQAIQQEAADALAFEQRFQNTAWIAAALATRGLIAFIYVRKHHDGPRRPGRSDAAPAARDGSGDAMSAFLASRND